MLTFTKINDFHYDIIDDADLCIGKLTLWNDGYLRFDADCKYVYDWKSLLEISNKIKELNNID